MQILIQEVWVGPEFFISINIPNDADPPGPQTTLCSTVETDIGMVQDEERSRGGEEVLACGLPIRNAPKTEERSRAEECEGSLLCLACPTAASLQ